MKQYSKLFSAAIAGFFFTLLSVLTCSSIFASGDEAPFPGNVVHMKRYEASDRPGIQFLAKPGVELKDGETYVLTFWAKASSSVPLMVLAKDTRTWGRVGARVSAELDTGWQRYELEFSGEKAEPGYVRLEFHYGNEEAGEIWIADIRVSPAVADEKSEVNLVTNGRFEDNLAQWYSEGRKDGIFQIEVQSFADANKSN